MILISHRGNLDGKDPSKENSPAYIVAALQRGFDVEIDVWLEGGKYLLGHDAPTYEVEESFLENEKLWCHAKDREAFEAMLKNDKIHCFWAEHDSFPLTSKKVIWTEPGKELGERSICVLPELSGITSKAALPPCLGVCSDHIERFV